MAKRKGIAEVLPAKRRKLSNISAPSNPAPPSASSQPAASPRPRRSVKARHLEAPQESTPPKHPRSRRPPGPSQEFALRSILDENATHYKIDWEDDSQTGQKFAPTWEPKAFANALAVADWQRQKANRKATSPRTTRKRKIIESSQSNPPQVPESSPQQHRTKAGKVVDSPVAAEPEIAESQFTPLHASSQAEGLPTPENEQSCSIERSDYRDITELSSQVQVQSPAVQVSQPPSSYRQGRYNRFGPVQPESSPEPAKGNNSQPANRNPHPLIAESIDPALLQSSLPSGPASESNAVGLLNLDAEDPFSPDYLEPNIIVVARTPRNTAGNYLANGNGAPSQLAKEQGLVVTSVPTNELSIGSSLVSPGEKSSSPSKGKVISPQVNPPLASTQRIPSRRKDSIQSSHSEAHDTQLSHSPRTPLTKSQRRSIQSSQPSQSPSEVLTSGRHKQHHLRQVESPFPGIQHSPAASGVELNFSQELQSPPAFVAQGQRIPPSQKTTAKLTPEPRPRPRASDQDSSSLPRPSVPAVEASGRSDLKLQGDASRSSPRGSVRLPIEIPSTQLASFYPSSRTAHYSNLENRESDFELPPVNQESQNSSHAKKRKLSTQSQQSRAAKRKVFESISEPSQSPFQIGETERRLLAWRQYSQVEINSSEEASLQFQTQIPLPPSSAPGTIERKQTKASIERPKYTASTGASRANIGAQPSGPNAVAAPVRKKRVSSKTARRSRIPPSSFSKSSDPALGNGMDSSLNLQSNEVSAQDAASDILSTAANVGNGTQASSIPSSLNNAFIASQVAPGGPSWLSLQDRARSPSTIPAVKQVPTPTKEEMNTSERYETLLPQAQEAQGNGQYQREAVSGPKASLSRTVRSDPNIIHIPVAFIPHQRDECWRRIYDWQKRAESHEAIANFLTGVDTDEGAVQEAESFVTLMRRITIHPDLANFEALTQYDNPKILSDWYIKCSSKFQFVHNLLKQLKGRAVKVALLTKGEVVATMLETLLQGRGVAYDRPDTFSESQRTDTDGLRVVVADVNAPFLSPESADLVISLESSVKPQNPVVESLRADKAPLLLLTVPGTIEHIETCLSSDTPPIARLRTQVSTICKLGSKAGKLEPGQAPLDVMVETIARHFLSTGEPIPSGVQVEKWPLQGLSTLEELDSQTESEAEGSANPHSLSDGDVTLSLTVKRHIDGLEGEGTADLPTKRQRFVDPPDTVNPQDVETTHISDSHKGSQGKMNSSESSSSAQPAQQGLKELLADRQAAVDALTLALEDLQFQHENQRTTLLQVTRERDNAIGTAQAAVQKMSHLDASTTSLRLERSELRQQLEEAKKKLLDYPIPEVQEFEILRQTTERLQSEKERADKRTAAAEENLSYVRNLYQDASSKMQKMVTDTQALETRNADLEIKASGEQTRAQKMSADLSVATWQRETHKLRAKVREYEAALKIRDDEIARLKGASRGRMGTRNSSIPRSPRLGSPIKGRGSRHTSPAPDGRTRAAAAPYAHPLRNG